MDRNDIEPGARWQTAIKKAIRDGQFFLACFSREYNERDSTYMNEELTLAIDELRARPHNTIWFIPILINETEIPSRPISRVEDLSHIQAVKLYENWNDGVRRILHVIKPDDSVSARPRRGHHTQLDNTIQMHCTPMSVLPTIAPPNGLRLINITMGVASPIRL